jgi:hypothetical protein
MHKTLFCSTCCAKNVRPDHFARICTMPTGRERDLRALDWGKVSCASFPQCQTTIHECLCAGHSRAARCFSSHLIHLCWIKVPISFRIIYTKHHSRHTVQPHNCHGFEAHILFIITIYSLHRFVWIKIHSHTPIFKKNHHSYTTSFRNVLCSVLAFGWDDAPRDIHYIFVRITNIWPQHVQLNVR